MLDEPSKATLITRPRRFGKSYNLSMLYYFFSIQDAKTNRHLFKNTLIENALTWQNHACMDHQGKYPTILFTLKSVRPNSYKQCIRLMSEVMSEVYQRYDFLMQGNALKPNDQNQFQSILNQTADATGLAFSLKKLTKYLEQYHNQKTMVLMDEYDTPFHAAYTSKEPFHEALSDFMKIFMGEAFKDNVHLKKAVITGILRIGLMDLYSGVNSIPVCSMMTKQYENFFGFTETETEALIKRYSQNLSATALSKRLHDVKDWYNGYNIGDVLLYNPWSILQYLRHDGELSPYWNASGQNSILGHALLHATFNVKNRLTQLLQGEAIDVPLNERTVLADLKRDEGALWNIMIYSGHLKVIANKSDENREWYTVAIPNKELYQSYRHMIENWFHSIGQSAYHALFNCLADGNLNAFEDAIRHYLDETISSRDLGRKTLEKYYHVLFLGMFFALKGQYVVDSNKAYGQGFYDVVLIPNDPKKPGYIFEFKATENEKQLKKEAQAALKQIDTKQYQARFWQAHTKQIYHVGMAFCGKAMQMVTRKC